MFTEKIRNDVIEFYNTDAAISDKFHDLRNIINYSDELKEICLERGLIKCNSKNALKSEPLNSKANFYKTIIRTNTYMFISGFRGYINPTKNSHLNKEQYWENIIIRAKRERNLKLLL